jgi:hypothetical protein
VSFAIAALVHGHDHAARGHDGGHPLWHVAIVAGGAVAVFAFIKAKESWHRFVHGTGAHRR